MNDQHSVPTPGEGAAIGVGQEGTSYKAYPVNECAGFVGGNTGSGHTTGNDLMSAALKTARKDEP